MWQRFELRQINFCNQPIRDLPQIFTAQADILNIYNKAKLLVQKSEKIGDQI